MNGEQHTIYRSPALIFRFNQAGKDSPTGGDGMKFDQVRREFKKTLWGEELDNERVFGSEPAVSTFQDQELQCSDCGKASAEDEMVRYRRQTYCLRCFQAMSEKMKR